jgi:hypothetical protein
MKMPNADLAVVDQDKVADYLLNPAHPENGGKAPFFLAQNTAHTDNREPRAG